MNLLAYAGCVHRVDLNEHGYVQIDIFAYDSNVERFVKVTDRPLTPSTTMKFNRSTVVGSCVMEKGLLVLLHLIASNSSILMCLQLQARPWLCHILYTLSIPASIHGSLRFLATNAFMSLFINEDTNRTGFYLIDNRQQKCQRRIETIPCSLANYLYCHVKDAYYWLMGTDIDSTAQRKSIKVTFAMYCQMKCCKDRA